MSARSAFRALGWLVSEFIPAQAIRCAVDRDFSRAVTEAGAAYDAGHTNGCDDDPCYCGAEQLAEREAEQDVAEPVERYCAAIKPWGIDYACTKPEGHNGDHGYGGVFWPNAAEEEQAPAPGKHTATDRLCIYTSANGTDTAAFCGVCRPVRDIVEQMIEERFPSPSHGPDGVSDTPVSPPAGHLGYTVAAAHPELSIDLASWADQRIVNMLSTHRFRLCNHSSIGSNDHCTCGFRPRGLLEWEAHVALAISNHLRETDLAEQAMESSHDMGASFAADFFPQHRKTQK